MVRGALCCHGFIDFFTQRERVHTENQKPKQDQNLGVATEQNTKHNKDLTMKHTQTSSKGNPGQPDEMSLT